MADAGEMRDYRIYHDFAYHLISIARKLYQNEELAIDLDYSLYAFDSTTIDLCLSLFPWAHFRKTKTAIKMHTFLDMRGAMPSFISLTTGKVHDVNILDILPLEKDAVIAMDRGYIDYTRLYAVNFFPAFFVIRAKSNLRCRRLNSQEVDKTMGLRSDQRIVLTGKKSRVAYPEALRRVSYVDLDTNKRFVYLTNIFTVTAKTIADIYKQRWQVELFFRWIKQHLKIKAFYGTSPNAVKTQIWIAVSIYLLVAILKKRLNLLGKLHTILQILEANVF
jgi:IS4 transposase